MMDEPAQTIAYFIAGYSVIFIGLICYLSSLYSRWRKLKSAKMVLERKDNS